MITIIISIIIGLIVTEIFYFKVIRKEFVLNPCFEDNPEYEMSEFIIEKLISIFIGVISGLFTYGLIEAFKDYTKEVLIGALVVLLVVLFFAINWEISKKIDRKAKAKAESEEKKAKKQIKRKGGKNNGTIRKNKL